ncbi:flavin-containing monooxygenase [Nocardia sp. CA-084685]|uniref:flavin-containing monooxygenase n=1 Tax=Nocardia sp. CA-084685 TaxID=3239970 RepID=UPI003D96EE3F
MAVVIVGAGFGGVAMALELVRSGHHDFVILEKASEAGGVWRENTYPGAACDVPSPYYSFSFAPNPSWPRRYSEQRDIKDYLNRLMDDYGLRPHIRFDTEVTGADFDAATRRWRIETNTGETLDADVFVPATGQLSRPAIPAISGRESFAGVSFHSAEWNHDYELAGKRVAVIGTGASAVQFVPRIQPVVANLTVFQRSAPYILPKPDTAYGRLHRLTFRRRPLLQSVERLLCWSGGELAALGLAGNRSIARFVGWIAKWNLRIQIPDEKLRAALTPDYPIGCKCVLFGNNFYAALTETNVHVVTEAITEITPRGIRTADGVVHDVDAIIYGTGFLPQELLAPMKIRNHNGRDLHDVWAAGARAYLGIAVPGFPNLFIMYGPNTNLGSGSIIYMLERQARYIRQLIEHLDTRPGTALDVRADVERHYDTEMQRRLASTVWACCASWYRSETGRISTNWPGLVSEYDRRTRRVEIADYRLMS